MSILSAIRHFVRITLFIACTPPPRTEAQLSMCLVTVKDEDTATAKSGSYNMDRGCACFQEKYYLGYVLLEQL